MMRPNLKQKLTGDMCGRIPKYYDEDWWRFLGAVVEMTDFIMSVENDKGQFPEFMWKWREELLSEMKEVGICE